MWIPGRAPLAACRQQGMWLWPWLAWCVALWPARRQHQQCVCWGVYVRMHMLVNMQAAACREVGQGVRCGLWAVSGVQSRATCAVQGGTALAATCSSCSCSAFCKAKRGRAGIGHDVQRECFHCLHSVSFLFYSAGAQARWHWPGCTFTMKYAHTAKFIHQSSIVDGMKRSLPYPNLYLHPKTCSHKQHSMRTCPHTQLQLQPLPQPQPEVTGSKHQACSKPAASIKPAGKAATCTSRRVTGHGLSCSALSCTSSAARRSLPQDRPHAQLLSSQCWSAFLAISMGLHPG